MILTISNVITVSNPSFDMERWVRKELVVSNPEYAKRRRMGLWTGRTPQNLFLYERRGDDLILPFGCINFIPKEILQDALIVESFPDAPVVDYHADVPLYDYQKKAVDAMYATGLGILQSAPGSGKTQMGIALAIKHQRRCLWLVHTLDLVKQSKERAKRYIKDESLIGEISAGKVDISNGITFATIQTMSRLDLSRYRDDWDVVIVDECHRVAGTPTQMTQYEKVINALRARHKYGLSATVHRSDGMIKATFGMLGRIAYSVPDEAVSDLIMPIGIKKIPTGVQLDRRALNSDGTLNYNKLLDCLCGNEERNRLIANTIQHDSSSLILSCRLDQLKTIMSMLPKSEQDKAVMIRGTTAKKTREKALNDLRSGKKKYLFATYSLAKEGLDIPRLERLYMATPQRDYAIVAQSIGRIARRCEGKTDAIVYDFVDDIGYLVKSFKSRRKIYKKQNCYKVRD